MAGPRRLLHNGDYLRLMSGQSISSLGTAMSSFVFTLLAMAITGSPVQAGLVGTAAALGGTVVSLPAGALVDRLNRRKVLVSCGLVGTVLYGSVAIAGRLDRLTIVHLIVVAFGSGAGNAFFMPAQNAALRTIVEPQDLGTAMAANEGRQHVAGLLGAPLGGALYSVGRVLPIAFDAVSYLFMTFMLMTIRRRLPAPRPDGDKHEPMLRAIRTGLKWVVRQPAIRAMAASATLINFAAGGALLVLILNLQRRGVHASTIGLLETGIGIGGVLGAVAAPALLRRFKTGRLGIVAAWIITLAFAATAFLTRPVILIVLLAGAIFLVPAFNSGLFGYQVMITPDGMQGRAQSAIGFLANATTPLAPALGGILLAHAGARTALIIFSGIMALSAVMLTLSGPIRAIPLLSEAAAAQAG
ncbi:putative MFS family arabinose efflux permease [Kribbella voronezhensis]|uniref:Putative MFS family arabinose efflux permease n=1 Tax=Kribbella voronezhensis TaxID=2512212 RepID=A0A4R7TE16_9ACTN|nr:MFS transporter [Kribbella voronezhensis]TDU90355.1 putative MFS family arabinose efflux permease [Kribbella voronezhensis]